MNTRYFATEVTPTREQNIRLRLDKKDTVELPVTDMNPDGLISPTVESTDSKQRRLKIDLHQMSALKEQTNESKSPERPDT